ncbi:Hpr(Ser) kinase/phosphatase [Novosphingobium sp. PhB165]|uniref:hypothetical protein n=1 Tax=Novosphingobium sp. PhB165 TaxID=2485105 RepID=UPI00104D3111|nr:hypothetical protein [Novosphingobium sp. PhB165]TCM15328.1 Hpr(Ser) kinase/phosphatase [Novosphingobium sp. PhB165]
MLAADVQPSTGAFQGLGSDRVNTVPTDQNLQWQFAPGVAVVSLSDRDALFCETAQKLYALDPFAALVARELTSGPAPLGRLIASCTRHGMDRQDAEDAVTALISLWSGAELLAVVPGSTDEVMRRFPLDLGGIPIDVEIGASLGSLAMPAAARKRPDAEAVPCWQIRRWGTHVALPKVVISRHGKPASIARLDQAIPKLKARLVDDVLTASDRIALHCALLVRGNRALLLSGAPGAGKSTLSVALTAAGFGYAADDVTLLDHAGMVQGLSFYPTLKRGSWHLLPGYGDVIGRTAVHQRLDGATLRYLPMPEPRTGIYPVDWIVLLARDDGMPAELNPLEPLATLEVLLQGAYARTGRSTLSDVQMLSRLVGRAQCRRLSYANLDEAVRLLHLATE